MKYLTSNEIRNIWLNFFKSKGHHVEPGASLVPINDPTLLWINAGVAALKKYFDGSIIPDNPRICNVQKAIRTNDIENVGHTARHHTFFEMMGNFSIGDYFRNEAIEFGFELLTSPKYFDIPKDLLYMTYFPDDKDTFNKWVSLGVDPSHMIKCEGNFWEIGEGPCGPDTEIFFDRGEKYDPNHIGIKLLAEDMENDRYIEIWNIVFSQFNSKPGIPRSEYKELPHKNIDTGAGLERFCLIMQGADTNYETDLFMPIINATEKISNVKYEGDNKTSFKIIADHLRTCTFALADGASFSNEGRGYVLRRLLRRAVRHGRKLGINHAFLASLVDVVINNMKDFYPYLLEKSEYIKNLVTQEELKFLDKLADGEKILNDLFNKNHKLTGQDAFLLYDTYGYPFEITEEFANENGITINKDEFDTAMEKQKELARQARGNKGSMKSQNEAFMDFKDESKFVGYDSLKENSSVIGLFELDNNQIGIVTKITPFYAEMGGECGDNGIIYNSEFEGEVVDCIKLPNGQHLHKVNIKKGNININDDVCLEVSENLRYRIQANHSATHLLDQALKDVLGNHVYQHGSSVTSNATRFDFNHFENVTSEQLLKIESIVKEKVKAHLPVSKYELPIEEAKKEGATAVFGEKYGKIVRIVNIDNYSKEFCGGCHVNNTSEINDFAINMIESKGSGIYRVECFTGNNIVESIKSSNRTLFDEFNQFVEKYILMKEKAKQFGLNVENINLEVEMLPTYKTIISLKEKLEQVKELIKNLDKEIKNKEANDALSNFNLEVPFKEVNGKKLIFVKCEINDGSLVKQYADLLQDKYKDSIIFVMSSLQDKVLFVAKCNQDHIKAGVNCGRLVKEAAIICGGNGGGRPDFAQAGGKDSSKSHLVEAKIEEIL